jgi:hypothetical protein
MANDYKMVNDQRVQLTDEEQKVKDAETKAWADATPARRMTELRKQRDALLAETDYMGLGDVTMSDEWKTYRQALRDITKQTPSSDELDENFLYKTITFPKRPTE